MPRTIPIKVLRRANPPTCNVAHFVRIGGSLRPFWWLTSIVFSGSLRSEYSGGPLGRNMHVVPKLKSLDSVAIGALADGYDNLAKLKKRRLPNAHLCDVQGAIDEVVCKYTGYDLSVCIDAHHLLSNEPAVTGQKNTTTP